MNGSLPWRTVPWGWMLYPTSVPGDAHPDSQDRSTNTCGNSTKGQGPPVSVALLNYWQRVIFWSHITYSLGQELYVLWSQKALSLCYWASPRVCTKLGNTSQTSVAEGFWHWTGPQHRLVRPKERKTADLLLVKTLVMNRKLDCQGGHPRTDTQPCSWPLPHQATWLLCFYFDAPSLQRSFSSILMKEGRNTPVCLSALRAPLSRRSDLLPTQGFS